MAIELKVDNHLGTPEVRRIIFNYIQSEDFYVLEVEGWVNQPGAAVVLDFTDGVSRYQETVRPDETGNWQMSITPIPDEDYLELSLESHLPPRNLISNSLKISFANWKIF